MVTSMDIDKTEADSSPSQDENEIGSKCLDWQDLDKADLDTMKGDNVGDTVYSSKWILQTLIELSKIGTSGSCSRELEEDLCTLWDMTAEKDVAGFLVENNFLEMAQLILHGSNEPRVTEITVGILGNMCCQENILQSIAESGDLVSTIFQLLWTDDTETLIQIVRLFQSVVWEIQKNINSKWFGHLKNCKFFGERLLFILQSSTNDDLLRGCIELMQQFVIVETAEKTPFLTDLIKVDQLFPALFEAFSQVVQASDVAHSYEQLKFIENWLTIFGNVICSHVESTKWLDDASVEGIKSTLMKIIRPYVDRGNLFPFGDRLAGCIYRCVEILHWLYCNEVFLGSRIISFLLIIMQRLHSALDENESTERTETSEAEELIKRFERFWVCIFLEWKRSIEDGSNDMDEICDAIQMCKLDVMAYGSDVIVRHEKDHPHSPSLTEKNRQTL